MPENIRNMLFIRIWQQGESVDFTDFSESCFLVGGQLSILASPGHKKSVKFTDHTFIQPIWTEAANIIENRDTEVFMYLVKTFVADKDKYLLPANEYFKTDPNKTLLG